MTRQLDFGKRGGFVLVIVQDANTLQVLMHGSMGPEQFKKTLQTRELYLWSLSRSEEWHKGATSNSVMRVESIVTDCDGDALLVTVQVTGTGFGCHLERKSCFVDEIEWCNEGL